MTTTALRTVAATRYVTPLREGGSLPALVEADDDGLYVVKFRGAGQGPRALVAELIAGELARALGLPVPEIVAASSSTPRSAATSPTRRSRSCSTRQRRAQPRARLPARRDDLRPGRRPPRRTRPRRRDRLVRRLVTNVDRTPRNPNLLVWHGELWLIDHGAALYHPARRPRPGRACAAGRSRRSRDHVLLPVAGPIDEADERLRRRLTPAAPRRGDRRRWCRRTGSSADAGRGYVDYLTRAPAAPRRVRRGGGACPRGR